MHAPESPEYVRTSLAASITMGFEKGSFFRDAKLYCINILLTYENGCLGSCAYCGLKRNRNNLYLCGKENFIRVQWATYLLEDVIKALKAERCHHVERVCVSMVTNPRAVEDILQVNMHFSSALDLPLSSLIAPSTRIDKNWLDRLRESGTDRVGIAIDTATPDLFDDLRGTGVKGPHRWDRYWEIVDTSCDVFGSSNVGVHLIVGIGETEEDMARVFQHCAELCIGIHLFSHFPESGSREKNLTQPPIGQYRRMQLLRHLISSGLTDFDKLRFNEEGQLTEFGISEWLLQDEILKGDPFRTSGCSGKTIEVACNRPYANCTPFQAYMGEFRNYPFALTTKDLEIVQQQIWDYNSHSIAPTIENAEEFIHETD